MAIVNHHQNQNHNHHNHHQDRSTNAERSIESSDESTVPSIQIKLEQLDGFHWDQACEQVLTSLSRTGIPPPKKDEETDRVSDWTLIILYNFRQIVQNYIRLGTKTLIDTRDGSNSSGWLWKSEDLEEEIRKISSNVSRGYDHQDRSTGLPENHDRRIRTAPFTIQRLAELVNLPELQLHSNTDDLDRLRLGIHPHYSTLPKYLRAIGKVLSVTSSVSTFSLDTFKLPHPTETHLELEPRISITNGSGSSTSGTLQTVRTRRPSTSTPVTPVLSPIQWLIDPGSPPTSATSSSEGGRRSRQTSPMIITNRGERPITPPLGTHHPPPIGSPGITEPHLGIPQRSPGRVDELDPGLGTAQEMVDGPIPIGAHSLGEVPILSTPISVTTTMGEVEVEDTEIQDLPSTTPSTDKNHEVHPPEPDGTNDVQKSEEDIQMKDS